MKLLLIFALALTEIRAQEPALPACTGSGSGQPCQLADVATAYQTARANALEAENAALKRTNADNQLTIALLQQALSKLMDDKYGNLQQLQAAQQAAQHALDTARDALKKACGDKWDEKTATCNK